MTGGKRIVNNVFFNWAGMATALIWGFIQAPIVVKGLGNTWYGIWILVSQIAGYTWLLDLGIREAVVRYVSSSHSRKQFDAINQIVSSAIYLYLFISLLTLVVFFVLAVLLPYLFKLNPDLVGTARAVLVLSGLNMVINWFFNAYVGILMGLQRFDIIQKVGIGMGVVNFILVVTAMTLGYGIIALSLISLGLSIVSNAIIYRQCKKLFPELKLNSYAKKTMQFGLLIKYGKYVLLNNIASKVVFGSDAVIIGFFLPVSAITYYAIPNQLVNYMRTLVQSATWVLNPWVSELESKGDMEKIKLTLVRGSKFSFLLGLPVSLVFLFLGENFISLWMGIEYGEGTAIVFAILTIGAILGVGHLIINSLLYGLSLHNIIAYVRVVEAVVNILVSVICIKTWGIIGVAFGSAVSHISCMGIILPIFVCKKLSFPLIQYAKESIVFPMLASIPFAICCFVVSRFFPAQNLVIFFSWVTFLMPVFIISVWLLCFSKPEKEEYTQMIRRYIPCSGFLSRRRIL